MDEVQTLVAPIEWHYAVLRNGWVVETCIQKGWTKGMKDFAISTVSIDDVTPIWDLETGKCPHNDKYDIVAVISPESLQAAANGEVTKLKNALKFYADKSNWVTRWDISDQHRIDVGYIPATNDDGKIARAALNIREYVPEFSVEDLT